MYAVCDGGSPEPSARVSSSAIGPKLKLHGGRAWERKQKSRIFGSRNPIPDAPEHEREGKSSVAMFTHHKRSAAGETEEFACRHDQHNIQAGHHKVLEGESARHGAGFCCCRGSPSGGIDGVAPGECAPRGPFQRLLCAVDTLLALEPTLYATALWSCAHEKQARVCPPDG